MNTPYGSDLPMYIIMWSIATLVVTITVVSVFTVICTSWDLYKEWRDASRHS